MFSGTLAIITSGMNAGWPSPSLEKLLNENSTIPITNEEGSWLAVMPLIGGIIGSILYAATIDILGRKKAVLLTSFPFFATWIMVAYAKSVTVLYVARIIGGAAEGAVFTVVPIYLGEIAEPKIRGQLGSSCSVTYIFGILLINIIGNHLNISITALISSIIPILLLITFVWMPESPYYLLMKGRVDEAKKSLKIFRGHNEVDAELNRIHDAVIEQSKNSGKILDLFTVKSNRKALFIMLGLRTAQQFSGTMAITFYAKTIFSQSNHISPNLATILYFSIQLFFAFSSSAIVDKSGRRPLLIISNIGATIALFAEGVYFFLQNCTDIDVSSFSFVQLVALILFVVMFNVGMQTIPILMLCEMFPTNIKAFALCVVDIYFCIIVTIISKFFQIMKDSFGMHVPFFAFAVCCVIGLVFIIFCVPETKGKTLEEIQQNLRYGEGDGDNNENKTVIKSEII